ncbi:hypothetical protein PRIC2_009576 [Phytophthora ramorum]
MVPAKGEDPHGQRLRKKLKKMTLNYMYATLGIEKDDSSDDDYIMEEDDESEEDELFSFDEGDAERTPGKARRSKGRKVGSSRRGAMSAASRMPTKKRRFSLAKKQQAESAVDCFDANEGGEPYVMKDSAEGRRFEPKPADGSDGDDKSEQLQGGDEVGEQLRPEYTPRKRASQHDDEIAALDAARDDSANVVPPFPSVVINTWEQFDNVFEEYKRKNKLKFRVRSSMKTQIHNHTHDEDQLPSRYEWSYRIFRCTHGVKQGSRSKGYRNRKSRYCGCKARLTPTVVQTETNEYEIVIRNENHTHSHPTSDSVAASYHTTKTLPLDKQDREDVKTLADARVSSKHIANFLNQRVGDAPANTKLDPEYYGAGFS